MNTVKLLSCFFLFLFACERSERSSAQYTAFIGADIVDGTGSAPIRNGVLLVQSGRIAGVGEKKDVTIPEGSNTIDVAGKTIVPGFINAHGHVGDVKGIDGGHYNRGNIIDNLEIYARYGITTVVSLGGDGPEAESLRAARDTATAGRARLFIAGEVIAGNTPEEAVAGVDRNDRMGVDFMKIRVDDNLGASKKMPEDVYRAVIKRSHELGYKIATHMYYLEDARNLLGAGTDMLAHSVRDLPVDDAFVTLLKEKNVPYCPTLTRELSTYVYGDTAEFFSDPFFLREYDGTTIRPLLDPRRQAQVRNSRSAKIYRQQLTTAVANLKKISDAGVPIVFGTDSGVPTRFIGYFEHLEMEMMADAGLTPMQIIVSATKTPAESLGLKDVGLLAPRRWADFIVLDADPSHDIRNMHRISAVYIGGARVKR